MTTCSIGEEDGLPGEATPPPARTRAMTKAPAAMAVQHLRTIFDHLPQRSPDMRPGEHDTGDAAMNNGNMTPRLIVPTVDRSPEATPAATAAMTYHGGHLLASVEVFTLFWGQ